MSRFPIDYELPASLIAQEPCEPRDHARLLTLRRPSGNLSHHQFFDLPELLRPGDLLVLNDTRVLPARLLGRRAGTGGKWEGLFLRALPDGAWELMCQTRGTLNAGETIDVEPGPLQLTLTERLPGGRWQARPSIGEPRPLRSETAPTLPNGRGSFNAGHLELLERHGQIPLPPYIRKGTARDEDRARYQTIFARQAGAVAAPTAGLHFTPRVFENLHRRGLRWTFVTLHVGPGTFQPIQTDDYTKHPMHQEWGELTTKSAAAIRDCKRRGGRIIAVGTTAVRVLESVIRQGSLGAWSGETDLFVYPPYDFRVVDGLITNFHLPRTTLLLLVAALAGVDAIRAAYAAAIAAEYRFYSYGDAMLIV